MAINISMSNYNSGRGKGEALMRDYAHAARTFVSDFGYTLTPKTGFSFHARLIYNSGNSFNLFAGGLTNNLSVLVKSAELPKFNIETEVLNKYNRKEVFQKKITYEPLQLTFHDDGANNVRDFWLAYNQYHYVDSNLPKQVYEMDDTYSPVRLSTRYGLDSGRIGRFLQSIELYSMQNHVYTKYTLLNPLITSFDFDTHDYSEGNKIMQATMRVEYENVIYAEGATEAIPGFGLSSFYYDNEFSPLKEHNLTYPNLTKTVDNTETDLYRKETKQKLSNYDVTAPAKVELSKQQLVSIRSEAINSLQGNSRFSFPTAKAIDNRSDLVSINANLKINQGVVNRSNAVSSNGNTVSIGPISSLGSTNASVFTGNPLMIDPKIPAGLTAAETEIFLVSYPSLPSTDPRTRSAPYA